MARRRKSCVLLATKDRTDPRYYGISLECVVQVVMYYGTTSRNVIP